MKTLLVIAALSAVVMFSLAHCAFEHKPVAKHGTKSEETTVILTGSFGRN